ncbi:PipX family protein [Waterburya agarophytonicola K14]|uniref:PipX family protein n=1 Tax=Waterburya agarophytonicola KI4 TaxID=2874699 RepID=A0A964BS95_9CYAN|nr:PipX family protein [Waterburya agarophytonicola KI4]
MNNQQNEAYLNHPTFGLLYRICLLKNNQELFTTLYAQRLFFIVTTSTDSLSFDPISRSDARLLVESLLRRFLLDRETEKHRELQAVYKRTFL